MFFCGTKGCDEDGGDTPVSPFTATHEDWIAQAAMGELLCWVKPLIEERGALQPPSRLGSPGEEPGSTQLSGLIRAGHQPQNYR